MSHEHAQDSRSTVQLPVSALGAGHAVQHITESDLLSTPPRITDPSRVTGRVESEGLGRPSFVVVECADGRVPAALVLEYGDSDAARARSARVWSRAHGAASSPLYRLSGDTSSGGYVTA